jgi:hypothetical protein
MVYRCFSVLGRSIGSRSSSPKVADYLLSTVLLPNLGDCWPLSDKEYLFSGICDNYKSLRAPLKVGDSTISMRVELI